MANYIHVDVSHVGNHYPFWIKKDGIVLAHTQLCRSREEVAHVLRNYLRGLWRKGHVRSDEKLCFNDPAVSEAWDLNRFKDRYHAWVDQVKAGEVRFKEPQ